MRLLTTPCDVSFISRHSLFRQFSLQLSKELTARDSMGTEGSGADSAKAVPPNAENVFVVVRLRPLNPCEIARGETDHWEVEDSRCLVLRPGHKHYTNRAEFLYDRTFETWTDSGTVYANVAKPMVESAMRGINATIFAYGQTGSGKTHTMKAMMDLASHQMFKHIQDDLQREFFIRVSAIEIYNEIVRDLLAPEEAQGSLRIMDDQDKGPVVEGLSEEGVSSIEHMEQILKIVQLRRQVKVHSSSNLQMLIMFYCLDSTAWRHAPQAFVLSSSMLSIFFSSLLQNK